MVGCGKAKASFGSARSRRGARSPNVIRNSQVSCASPGQLSEALRDLDLVVVIGAPVFTFMSRAMRDLRRRDQIFQITDDPDAAAVTPSGASIIAMKPALAMLLDLLPESKRAMPAGRVLPAAPSAADPLPVEFLPFAVGSHARRCGWWRKRPRTARRCKSSCRCAARTVLHHGERRPRHSLPAAVGMALGRPGVRTVCLIGDGSAMYSIQALWTAARASCRSRVVVINNAGYGAMRSFSQVMQVRNVPGLSSRHRFRQDSPKAWAATPCR
jgi:benzoylformate decarboxylase